MIPDTPPRREGERETSADEAEESKTVTISQKELTRILQLLSSVKVDERTNEITPNVSPLAPESKEHDMQEKTAAPEGEKAPTLAELIESQKAINAMGTQLQKEVRRTPVRTPPLFPGTTLECSEQLKNDCRWHQ